MGIARRIGYMLRIYDILAAKKLNAHFSGSLRLAKGYATADCEDWQTFTTKFSCLYYP